MYTPDYFLNGRFLRILLIFSFLFIIHNLLILYFHKPQGYMVDIYSVLPLSFFCATIFCYLISSFILLFNQDKYEKIGILLLILNHVVILLIPYMLGYYSMGRADDMTYIGEYIHIRETGSIAGWDIYPGSLILGASLSLMSGLPTNGVAFVIPAIFSFLFISGLYLYCRFFLRDILLMNVAVLSCFILYLGPYNFLNVPHALFFAYIPLFIFILSRYILKIDFANTILLLIPTILIPFMHPFIVFFVFSLLISLVLFDRILSQFIQGSYRCAIRPLTILLMGFFSWFIYCNTLLGSFRFSLQSYLQKTSEPILLQTAEKLVKINVDLFKVIKLLFIYYGRYFIPLFIIIIAFILVYLKREKISQIFKNRMYFFLSFYTISLVVEAILFLNPLFIHESDRMTNLNFIVYAQVPLFVLSLSLIFMKVKFFNRQAIILLLLLTFTWSLGLFGALDSPNIFRPNNALTYNEVNGMKWFYETRGSENTIVPLSQIDRFHDLFDDRDSDKLIKISDHFGYDSSSRTFAEINLKSGQQGYVILLTYDELLYKEVPGWKEVGRYSARDYFRFRNDRSVHEKIYDNVNIEIYYIY